MSFFGWEKSRLPTPAEALPGRPERAFDVALTHFVNGNRQVEPFPDGSALAMFGMGCFWGAERKFWSIPGVHATMVGYAGGFTPHPTYREVCTGRTGHNEVVRLVYDPRRLGYQELLKQFWEGHDPTQGMRQGNDVGTQYRSGIYVYDPAQRAEAEESRTVYAGLLRGWGFRDLTTEIVDAPAFWYAEDYHQQYLAKNPDGYCGLGGTGVSCPVGVRSA